MVEGEQSMEVDAQNQPDEALEKEAPFPKEIRLDQNYPVAFNAATVLRFESPKASTVCLTVYDVLRRQVAEPVAGAHLAGRCKLSKT